MEALYQLSYSPISMGPEGPSGREPTLSVVVTR